MGSRKIIRLTGWDCRCVGDRRIGPSGIGRRHRYGVYRILYRWYLVWSDRDPGIGLLTRAQRDNAGKRDGIITRTCRIRGTTLKKCRGRCTLLSVVWIECGRGQREVEREDEGELLGHSIFYICVVGCVGQGCM